MLGHPIRPTIQPCISINTVTINTANYLLLLNTVSIITLKNCKDIHVGAKPGSPNQVEHSAMHQSQLIARQFSQKIQTLFIFTQPKRKQTFLFSLDHKKIFTFTRPRKYTFLFHSPKKIDISNFHSAQKMHISHFRSFPSSSLHSVHQLIHPQLVNSPKMQTALIFTQHTLSSVFAKKSFFLIMF